MATTTGHKSEKRGLLFKLGVPAAIIALGVGMWGLLKLTAPEIKRKHHAAKPTVVEVVTAAKIDATAFVGAMGVVSAATEVELRSRVSGDVVALGDGFTPGGHVDRDAVLVRLDKADYQIELLKAQAALDKAKADLDIEQGSQAVAKEEMRLMSQAAGEEIEATDLILRAPQLKQAVAGVASAKAAVNKAKLDLERTTIRAPFNALIIERNANVGSHVKAQETIATLVGTDEFWVEAAVPLDRITALKLGRQKGSEVIVTSTASGGQWKGRALRLTGKLTENGRLAKVIVAVEDPLGLKSNNGSPQMMLDDYVGVRIAGKPIKDVIELPRLALREGAYVWVLKDGQLDIRKVDTAWKQADNIFVVSGIKSGERVIVSDLAAPVQGMSLRAAGDPLPEPKQSASAQGSAK